MKVSLKILNSAETLNITQKFKQGHYCRFILFELWHEISNNLVCATSKASDQPEHTRSPIRAFASCLNIL